MAPSIVWGIGIGLVIAAIDTALVVGAGAVQLTDWPIADIDFLANVVLYTLIGFQVGKATGVLRDAAEGGVMAGVLVGAIAIGVTTFVRPPLDSVDPTSTSSLIRVMAENIALGGVLSLLSGFLGTRSRQEGPTARR
ncbi:MAG: hypothetical protein U0893_11230 [Chloroflexota bacterium]